MKRLVAFCVLTFVAATAYATDLHFTPLSIPVRDGKTLAADLYYADDTPQPKPVILIQTPYNKLYYRVGTLPGEAGSMFPTSPDYNYVVVDWRGFYGSSSAAVAGYDRGLDGYDCVEWIAGQPWSNGKVGTWGSSALGYIQFQTARHQPPHLVCGVPRVKGMRTLYSDYYYGGVYRKEHVESLAALGFVSTALILSHPTYDLYWQFVEASSIQASDIAVPMLLVGGWYDHFPDDVLGSFADLRTQGAPAARADHRLIVGPWTHSGVGELQQGILQYPDAVDYDTQKVLRFWDHYLRGLDNGWDSEPIVSYYRLGEGGWVSAASWEAIPRQTLHLNLQPGGRLSTLPPPASDPDLFSYDPGDPTPALGGSRFNPFDPSVAVGPVDLAPVEARSDVKVFTTDVLREDLRINGSIAVELQISSDRTDTDFCIRLTDVFPDGTSVIMTQGIRRARFRDSYTTQTLLTPGTVTPVTVELQNIALTIVRGHRLRIVVCSADYPHFDKNLNDGGPMYVDAPGLVAANSVHHSPSAQSRLSLQILPPSEPPPPPADLTATAAGTDRIDLSWTDVAISETSFALEWSANGTAGWNSLATLPADSTSFQDSGLPPGTTRYYRIRAVNSAGVSAPSGVATATTDTPTATATVTPTATPTASPGATLPAHDSVVLPLKPLTVKIPAGTAAVTRTRKVTVRNADILPIPETPGHTVQLVVGDGDCPAGTVVGLPDFNKSAAGAQDSVLLAGGKAATAVVTLNITAAGFTSFNHLAPARCRLTFSVTSPGSSDPAPANNTATMELNVLDANDPEQTAVHETFVNSLNPLKLTIGARKPTLLRTVRLQPRNADILPVPESSGDLITVTVNEGDCPAGTIGVADFDKSTVGSQDTVTIKGGKAATGSVPLTATAAGFTTRNKKSPARCTATLRVTGPGGDSDASNNTTTLVIDVYDKNDW